MAAAGGSGLLANKLVLVTGASRGIGQAIAETYAKEGAQLILTAEPPENSNLKNVAQLCRDHGAKADVILADLSVKGDISHLTQEILADHPEGLHVLVNNAGVLGPIDYDKGEHMGQGPLDGDPDDWERTVAVNLIANMRLTRTFAPYMRDRGEGWIVAINSTNGLKAGPTNPSYCASKWGSRGWSISCHESLKEHGIRVTTIYPPATSTPMTWDRPDLDPVTELEAQPEDIADAALLPFRCTQNALPVEIVMQTLRNYKKS